MGHRGIQNDGAKRMAGGGLTQPFTFITHTSGCPALLAFLVRESGAFSGFSRPQDSLTLCFGLVCLFVTAEVRTRK